MDRVGLPFGVDGQALVYAGEAVAVGFRLQQADGAGGWEAQDLAGRSFALRVFGAGTASLNLEATVASDDDGAFLAVDIAGADSAGLLPSPRESVRLRWAFEELTLDGGRSVLAGSVFNIRRGSDPTLDEPAAGVGEPTRTIYTLRPDGALAAAGFTGAPGISAYAFAVLGGYEGTAEQYAADFATVLALAPSFLNGRLDFSNPDNSALIGVI